MAASWDPSQYLKFARQRSRPALDLLARVELDSPGAVFDLGCGAGNVTRVLAQRWPGANITGVDASPEMLETARHGDSAIRWQRADLKSWAPDGPADLLFSNAALHWLDDHRELFGRLAGFLGPGGVLAVQMPRNYLEPSHTSIAEAARSGPWADRLAPVLRPQPVSLPETYYEILSPLVGALDIWESVYLHVLDGDDPVLEWFRSTALKPLLEALDGDQRRAFTADYAARVRDAYPKRADGKTLFSMRRLFIVAVK